MRANKNARARRKGFVNYAHMIQSNTALVVIGTCVAVIFLVYVVGGA